MGRKKKVDIIEQLEEGKKLQEEGIDEESLRTKIETSELKNNEDNIPKEEDATEEEKEVVTPKDARPEIKLEKKESKVPPDFDFNNFYELGQEVYYVKVNPVIGEKFVITLKIRTIFRDAIIGVIQDTYLKGRAQYIGYVSRDNIFETLVDAKVYCDSIKLEKKNFTTDTSGEE